MSSNIRITRICQYCGKTFEARTTVTRTCSDPCAKRLYKQRQKEAKIEKSDTETRLIKQQPLLALHAKEFLSIPEACTLLGISRRTIYRLLERAELNAGKVGGRTLIKRSEIDKLFS